MSAAARSCPPACLSGRGALWRASSWRRRDRHERLAVGGFWTVGRRGGCRGCRRCQWARRVAVHSAFAFGWQRRGGACGRRAKACSCALSPEHSQRVVPQAATSATQQRERHAIARPSLAHPSHIPSRPQRCSPPLWPVAGGLCSPPWSGAANHHPPWPSAPLGALQGVASRLHPQRPQRLCPRPLRTLSLPLIPPRLAGSSTAGASRHFHPSSTQLGPLIPCARAMSM